MENVQRLEVHYHLANGSHSMDAEIRNKCEAETLAVFQYIAESLGFDVEFETSAWSEGGLKETWKIITKKDHVAFAGLLVALASLILAIYNSPPKPNPELERQQIEINNLTIREKTLVVEQLTEQKAERLVLRRRLVPPPSPNVDVPDAVPKRISLQTDMKVITRRSNFYKMLLPYQKVTGVGFAVIPFSGRPSNQTYVPRAEFVRFIRQTDKLPTLVVHNAVIEIVSPVLREGDIQWKGIWGGKTIGFAMKDRVFKGQVMRKEVKFQHGDAIGCVLHIERKTNEVGDEVVSGYTVKVVSVLINGEQITETARGRKKKFADAQAKAQREFDYNLNFDEGQS